MSLAYEQKLSPEQAESNSKLIIEVVFTSVDLTLSALQHASVLAGQLGARINLVVAQVVPYPLPLTSPPLLIDWNEKRFQQMATGSSAPTSVQVHLCRDRSETLPKVLRAGSLVIIGVRRRRWWPTADERLAGKLRRAGHAVIFTEMEYQNA